MAVPFPLDDRTLIEGPSNTGKTTTTADALLAWAEERGTEGVVVLDFAPELERDGAVLGGRLSRTVDVPDGVWTGVLDAYAPRATGKTENESLELATVNAHNAAELFAAAPSDPRAVFVNDATIPFQSDALDAGVLLDYCEPARGVVLNAFSGDELGDGAVSRFERRALTDFREWADRVVER